MTIFSFSRHSFIEMSSKETLILHIQKCMGDDPLVCGYTHGLLSFNPNLDKSVLHHFSGKIKEVVTGAADEDTTLVVTKPHIIHMAIRQGNEKAIGVVLLEFWTKISCGKQDTKSMLKVLGDPFMRTVYHPSTHSSEGNLIYYQAVLVNTMYFFNGERWETIACAPMIPLGDADDDSNYIKNTLKLQQEAVRQFDESGFPEAKAPQRVPVEHSKEPENADAVFADAQRFLTWLKQSAKHIRESVPEDGIHGFTDGSTGAHPNVDQPKWFAIESHAKIFGDCEWADFGKEATEPGESCEASVVKGSLTYLHKEIRDLGAGKFAAVVVSEDIMKVKNVGRPDWAANQKKMWETSPLYNRWQIPAKESTDQQPVHYQPIINMEYMFFDGNKWEMLACFVFTPTFEFDPEFYSSIGYQKQVAWLNANGCPTK